MGEMGVTKTLMIAGGGTGGHLYPGIAVACAILARTGIDETRFFTGPVEDSVNGEICFSLRTAARMPKPGMPSAILCSDFDGWVSSSWMASSSCSSTPSSSFRKY